MHVSITDDLFIGNSLLTCSWVVSTYLLIFLSVTSLWSSLVMDLARCISGWKTESGSKDFIGRWSSQRSLGSTERERRLRTDTAGP